MRSLRIDDLNGVYEVRDGRELESVLGIRYLDGVNSFWLYDRDKKYPALSISVNRDLAYLYYVVNDRDTGSQSVGHPVSLPEGDTAFAISLDGDTIEVPNTSTVPFSIAVKAAIEFLSAEQLPSSVEWMEL